jgi:hypothetical protein
VAAYLEPSADVEPYTRTVSLPSPPSDRLFVDRARSGEARALVDEHADDHVQERRRARQPARRDVDEDAEWARIVAAFEAEHGRTVVDEDPADRSRRPRPSRRCSTARRSTTSRRRPRRCRLRRRPRCTRCC